MAKTPLQSSESRSEVLKAKSDQMRERSGHVTTQDPLVAFLYLLARNGLPIGTVEDLMGQVEEAQTHDGAVFTNGWLATWAQDAAARLRVAPTLEPEQAEPDWTPSLWTESGFKIRRTNNPPYELTCMHCHRLLAQGTDWADLRHKGYNHAVGVHKLSPERGYP